MNESISGFDLNLVPMQLEYYVVPQEVHVIRPLAFSGCKLRAVFIGNGVYQIARTAFLGCCPSLVLVEKDSHAARYFSNRGRSTRILELDEEEALRLKTAPQDAEELLSAYAGEPKPRYIRQQLRERTDTQWESDVMIIELPNGRFSVAEKKHEGVVFYDFLIQRADRGRWFENVEEARAYAEGLQAQIAERFPDCQIVDVRLIDYLNVSGIAGCVGKTPLFIVLKSGKYEGIRSAADAKYIDIPAYQRRIDALIQGVREADEGESDFAAGQIAGYELGKISSTPVLRVERARLKGAGTGERDYRQGKLEAIRECIRIQPEYAIQPKPVVLLTTIPVEVSGKYASDLRILPDEDAIFSAFCETENAVAIVETQQGMLPIERWSELKERYGDWFFCTEGASGKKLNAGVEEFIKKLHRLPEQNPQARAEDEDIFHFYPIVRTASLTAKEIFKAFHEQIVTAIGSEVLDTATEEEEDGTGYSGTLRPDIPPSE